ncbi:fatty acid desaturase [Dactylosporangium siamense]|uniref:Fatty acid desaturase domain-containing protein n=1 Tax=Dactylosporangium siamense TaxID=685454 RepID=A0A919PN72_9ACTN|nr:fatty acid desaturase [Dactylosporangium siamense]GIG47686.1 hypothetical protein Dsi01nite_057270 [Dactylosporangium siamense]
MSDVAAIPGPARDVRESMLVLPTWLQPVLTWVTGKPTVTENSWRLRPVDHLLASIAPLLFGVAVGWAAVLAGGWWLLVLPVSWLSSVHGMRKLGSVILHQCTHATYSRRKWVNRLLGGAIAAGLGVQEYEDYSREHVSDHHSLSHMTMADPTARFIVETMRCEPLMSGRQMWLAMFRTMLSPAFQVRQMFWRLSTHRTAVRAALLMLTLAAEIALFAGVGSWWIALLVWVIPLTVLYNWAAVLRVSCRHLFPAAGHPLEGRAAIALGTHGIFLGEAVPDPALRGMRRARGWASWWLRMLFVHLFNRLFVLVGDGPCHDYHHRFPRSAQWVNYPFARRDDIAAGHPMWLAYTEVWGLRAAIDEVFSSLRQADPAIYRREPVVVRLPSRPPPHLTD